MRNIEKILLDCIVYTLNKNCIENNNWGASDIVLYDENNEPCFNIVNVGCVKQLSHCYYCYNCAITLRKFKLRLRGLRLRRNVSY